MKVSVVIPAFNEESCIARTIKAALSQDYHDFEIIVVDNASTDKTNEIARQFEGKNIHQNKIDEILVKVVHESNKGLLHARERGRKESVGEIIFNMDADCIPTPNHISQSLKYFDKNHADRTVAVTGPYDYYDGHPIFRHTSLFFQRYIYRFINYILQLSFIKGGAILIGGNNFIRADVLTKAGGYNVLLTFYGEDTDTAKRVAPHGTVRFDPNLLMKTSARRFKEEGNLQITTKYVYHFWKTIFSSVK